MLGGTAGVAQAQTSAPVESVHAVSPTAISCTTWDAVQTALFTLSSTVSTTVINEQLGYVIDLLTKNPPEVQPTLAPAYGWLLNRLEVLRVEMKFRPNVAEIVDINLQARQLAAVLMQVGCTA